MIKPRVKDLHKTLNGGVQRCGLNAHGQVIVKLPQGYLHLPERFCIANASGASRKYGLRLIYRGVGMSPIVVKTSDPSRLYTEYVDIATMVHGHCGLYRQTLPLPEVSDRWVNGVRLYAGLELRKKPSGRYTLSYRCPFRGRRISHTVDPDTITQEWVDHHNAARYQAIATFNRQQQLSLSLATTLHRSLS